MSPTTSIGSEAILQQRDEPSVQYVVSWNFRHIVNASLRPTIERICRDAEYDPPILCTPEELLEVNDD